MTTFSGTVAIRAMNKTDSKYQATIFPGTEAGLISALASAGVSGRVMLGPGDLTLTSIITIPASTELWLGAGTYTMNGASGFSLGMGAMLKGQGYNSTKIVVGSTFTGQAVVFNTTQDGTQQACMMECFEINGNRAAGGNPVNAIYIKGVGQPTVVRDVVIYSMAQRGITLEGVSINAASITYIDNCWVNNCLDHGIVVTGPMGAVTIHRTSVETIPANKAGIYIDGASAATTQGGIWIRDIHIEVLAANAIGILLEDSKDITVDNVLFFGSGGNGDLVKITGTPLTNSYNCTLRNLYVRFNATATTVNDVSNGVTLTNEVHYYSTGDHRLINNLTVGGTIDGTGNVTFRGANNKFGTVGVAQVTTVGQGGGGAFAADMVVNSGNSGATKSRYLLQRNAQTDLLLQGDGTLEYIQARHNLQLGTTAGAQTALLTTTGKLRLGSSGTPVGGLEVATGDLVLLTSALTDQATIATDASLGNIFTVTLGGNRTMGAPTNPHTGESITYQITQDGTGGRTLAWNAVFKQAWSDTGNTLGKSSSISFWYNGTNWLQQGAQSAYI